MQKAAKPNRLAGQVNARYRFARGGVITFIKDEVYDLEYCFKPVRQLMLLWYFKGDLRLANFRLSAHDALCNGRRGGKKRSRDFFRRQVTNLAQRHGRACFGG